MATEGRTYIWCDTPSHQGASLFTPFWPWREHDRVDVSKRSWGLDGIEGDWRGIWGIGLA